MHNETDSCPVVDEHWGLYEVLCHREPPTAFQSSNLTYKTWTFEIPSMTQLDDAEFLAMI